MNCAARLCLRVGQSVGAISAVGWRWHFGGLRPPAHPSTHRLGPLRGRLVPQPQSFRAGRPACLVGLAFAGTLRVLIRSALSAVAWGSACPPAARAPRFAWAPCGRPGGRPAATLAGTVAASRRRRCIPVASLPSLRWPSLSPFGRPHIRSALTAVTSRPLRCASCPCRVGVRLAALPPRSYCCVSVSPRPRLGGACEAGGARHWRLPTGLRPRSRSGAGAP